ncbi:hypothetical protein ITJ38_17810 [Agreia pratensis]|uniref:hypothetical protein n=1 Tax=Agreia pratensis TaxID=150121 RepID=UPI00188D0ABC|nr:hypothetical protein [Agreia pratensis]MBF4636271.1 hypothetical protein [Agreia pratensis]
MTHPAHAMEAALLRNPRTIASLIELVREDIPATSIYNNALAQQAVEEAEDLIVRRFGSGATLCTYSDARRWNISWYEGWYMLHGHAYVDVNDQARIDAASPLLLIDRRSGAAVYGPELEPLVRRIIAHSLIYKL